MRSFASNKRNLKRGAMSAIETVELYAWIGEDELGSGEIGLKQGTVPAGCIPLVAVDPLKMVRLRGQMEQQARVYGKRIRLCRFSFVEVLIETVNGK